MPALSNPVQIVSIAVSAGLILLILELVRRRRLTEEYSLIWIVCGVALLGLSLWRGILDVSARWLGVYYPPALLLLVLVFFVLVASLSVSVVISGQRRQIDHLVEELAVIEARLREVEAGRIDAVAAPEVIAGSAHDGQKARDRADVAAPHGVGDVEKEDDSRSKP